LPSNALDAELHQNLQFVTRFVLLHPRDDLGLSPLWSCPICVADRSDERVDVAA
jgi:hypothetical protein